MYSKLENKFKVIYPDNSNATYMSLLNYSDDLSKPFQRWFRYKEGFFIQEFVNNKQIEKPDTWLDKGFYWEEKKEEEAIDIPFFGYVENTKLKDPVWVKAVPYDVKIVGNENGVVRH